MAAPRWPISSASAASPPRVKREVEAGNQVAVVVSAMAGTTNQLVAWMQRARSPPARRAPNTTGGRHRRAGHRRPAGDRAADHRRDGALLAGLAGPDPHRRRPRQGAHRRRSTGREPARRDAQGRSPVIAGFQGIAPRRPHHHPGPRRLRHLGGGARRGAEGRALRHLHRRRRRLHHRPAHRRQGPQARAASPTRRCWRWPRWAPRCCRPARSSWPWQHRVRVQVLSSFERPAGHAGRATRTRSWKSQIVSGIAYSRDEAQDHRLRRAGPAGRRRRHLRPAGRRQRSMST